MLLPRLAFPDARAAVAVDGSVLSYAAFSRAAGSHSHTLTQRGIVAGDRVGVITHGTLDTITAIVGNACAGVVTVPINPNLGTSELEHVLRDAAPSAVFGDTRDEFSATSARLGELFAPIETNLHPSAPPARAVDDQTLLLLYTSGTTGPPKGALITARNVASNIDGLARAWHWTDSDTVAHALPLFHVHGLVLGLFGSLRVGGTLAHLSRFDAGELGRTLERSTMLFAVPTMYHRMIEAAESSPDLVRALSSARLLISGSAALTVREHKRIEALTGRGVHERYGLTESLIACAVPASEPARAGYVGPAVPGVEVRLVDDARAEMDCHDDATIGEVAVRGASVFAGYLNRDEATRAVIDADGWFYTGDLATRTERGWIRIVGRRATDLIKTGGYKVGAGEIESCLLEHPSVRECAVVGVEDPDLGERIVAHVVLADDAASVAEAELAAFVSARLAPHKRPRSIVFAEALPRNAMGKIMKARLRS